MTEAIDIYALTNLRDRKTIDHFLDTYVDRETSEDRNDEELSMWPLAETKDGLQSVTESPSFEEYDWEPSYTLSNVVDRGLQYPRRAFSVYLNSIDKRIDRVILCFTADNQLVLGLSIFVDIASDELENAENEELAEKVLKELMQHFNSCLGLIAYETPPPFTEREFLAMASSPLPSSGQ